MRLKLVKKFWVLGAGCFAPECVCVQRLYDSLTKVWEGRGPRKRGKGRSGPQGGGGGLEGGVGEDGSASRRGVSSFDVRGLAEARA